MEVFFTLIKRTAKQRYSAQVYKKEQKYMC